MPEILSSDVVESIDNEYSDEEGDDYDDTETATKPFLWFKEHTIPKFE